MLPIGCERSLYIVKPTSRIFCKTGNAILIRRAIVVIAIVAKVGRAVHVVGTPVVVLCFWIDHRRCTASAYSANHAANSCTGKRPDRTGNGTDCRARHSASTGTDAGRQIVLVQLIGMLWIGHLSCAFASHGPGRSANACTNNRADRTANGTNGRTGCCTGTEPTACCQIVLAQVVATLRIDHLSRTATSDAAGNGTNAGPDDGANRPTDCTNNCARRSTGACG